MSSQIYLVFTLDNLKKKNVGNRLFYHGYFTCLDR